VTADAIADPIERFIDHLNARNWEGLATLVAEQLVRIGPDASVRIFAPPAYAAWLTKGMVGVEEYRKDIRRITYAADRRSGTAEVDELLVHEGRRRENSACYSFELDERGKVTRFEVYAMAAIPDIAAAEAAAAR
jgi:hypothetical protein